MKFKLTYLIIALLSISNVFAQNKFQEGYFIKNNGEKVNCLIKNEKWQLNPIQFKYQDSGGGEVKKIGINSVQEFSIINELKFIRKKVKIDASTKQLSKLDYNKDPIWEERTIFLNVILTGDASLYSYEGSDSRRYFYNIQKGDILQLVYKRYKKSEFEIIENNRFKQQIFSSFFSCNNLHKSSFDILKYTKNSLSKIFNKYNSCIGGESINFGISQPKLNFNLSAKLGLYSSSLRMEHKQISSLNTNFGSNTGLRFGIEGELIFPKEKWGLFFGIIKNSDIDKTVVINTSVEGQTQDVRLVLKSLEMYSGIRHYFELSRDSKLSIQAGYAYDTRSTLNIDFELSGTKNGNQRGGGYVFTGLGFHYNKFSVDGRVAINKSVFKYIGSSFRSKVSEFNLTLGYTIL